MSNFTGNNFTEYRIQNDWSPAKEGHRSLKMDWEKTLGKMGADIGKFEKTATKALGTVKKKGTEAGKKPKDAFKAFGDAAKRSISMVSSAITNSLVRSIGDAITKVLELSAAFETQIAGVATLIETRELPALDKFTQALDKISRTGDQSVVTLGKAAYQAISATGANLAETQKLVQQADYMATAGMTTTDVAVKALTMVRNAWGKSAGSFTQISDVLFQTVRKGVTTFPLLAKSLGNVASVASLAKIDFRETTAAFAALTKSGLSSATSMTYLKNLIVGILGPGKSATAEFRKLGIEFGAVALKQRGLIGIMEQIREKTNGNAEAFRRLFPNLRSFSSAASLAGQQFEVFRDILASNVNSVGSTEHAYNQFVETFKFQSDQLKNIINSIWRRLGAGYFDQMTDVVKSLNTLLNENIDTFAKWGSSLGDAVVELSKASVKLLALFIRVNKITDNFAALKKTFDFVLFSMTNGLSEIIGKTRAFFAVLTVGLSEVVLATMKLVSLTGGKPVGGMTYTDTTIGGGKEKAKQSSLMPSAADYKHTLSGLTIGLPGGATNKFLAPKAKTKGRQGQDTIADSIRLAKEWLRSVEKIEKAQMKAFGTPFKDAEKSMKGMLGGFKRFLTELTKYKALTQTKDKNTLYSIVFGTEEQIQKQYGKMLGAVGKNSADLKQAMMSAFSQDTIAQMAVWWGSFTKTGVEGAKGFTSQVQKSFDILVSGLGNAWATLWSDLVSGQENAGGRLIGSIVGIIGDLAMSWGGYFAAMIPGLIAQYNYPGAAAAAAGAAAMFAIGGIAKGASSSLSSGSKIASTGIGASSGAPGLQTSMPGANSGQPGVIRETFIMVTPPGYEGTSDENRFRHHVDWLKRNQRRTGRGRG